MSLRRLKKEFADITKDPAEGIRLFPIAEDLYHWMGIIQAPDGSAYEGAYFEVDIVIPSDYPFGPPKVKFLTKIYLSGLNSAGSFCCPPCGAWSPALTITKYLLAFLVDPLTEGCCNRAALNLFKSDPKKYWATARAETKKLIATQEEEDLIESYAAMFAPKIQKIL